MPEIALPTPPRITSTRFTGRHRSLRSVLKTATKADHTRLDGMLGKLNLCRLADYRRFLEINAAALLPLEGALVAAGVHTIIPDWDSRARSGAIVADLTAIDGAVEPLDPPTFPDHFAMLGTLYVLEGSRLGAAHLLKNVSRTTDERILGATAFLEHGAGQHLWPSFLALLEGHAAELVDEDDIVFPARNAFDLFAKAATRP
jgi:heme oxygenase (biliverdin-IX-beta and delta-forming)